MYERESGNRLAKARLVLTGLDSSKSEDEAGRWISQTKWGGLADHSQDNKRESPAGTNAFLVLENKPRR